MQTSQLTGPDIINMAKHAILSLDKREAECAAREALEAGLDPIMLIEKGFVAGMKEIGDMFEEDKITMTQIFAASKIMDAGINILKPWMDSPEHKFCLFGNIAMNV
ncbi:B12-binding domain-containing protein [Methanolobus sp.]|uniref:cobalamin B12-binding domain-containing protein n=1 Tax=Methanolobus sp. TaxID=1874737 RepID=UPI0025FE658D|nr:B12-binding domain-containing protein [Methanolobus sp.]